MLKIIAIGHKMPKWISDGFQEYQKRLTQPWKLELIELTPEKNKVLEAKAILSKISRQDCCVALDPKGHGISTEQLALKLTNWQVEYPHICFLIGGADGLDQSCLDRANYIASLSALTFPHQFVKIIMAEQLYRAVSILNHHPYHRS
ncbi:MAG: 23S rRNA (pseudouridine(1915)-N(3))-methyltransferase RlmH [Gammaproteobacteria bacterium]|nr:23S rRNA (pseudouridine(1915)-N(3))-methyltransferase RlmH [Gammaproteobacteria bacterium]